MKANQTAPRNIDEYITGFPDEVQKILGKVRATIKKAAPKAEETISYQIPTFTLRGRYLIYFAGYKKHIGLYPAPTGVEKFKAAIAEYGSGKATLKFPLEKPIPFGLISNIVKFRVKKDLARAKAKGKQK